MLLVQKTKNYNKVECTDASFHSSDNFFQLGVPPCTNPHIVLLMIKTTQRSDITVILKQLASMSTGLSSTAVVYLVQNNAFWILFLAIIIYQFARPFRLGFSLFCLSAIFQKFTFFRYHYT